MLMSFWNVQCIKRTSYFDWRGRHYGNIPRVIMNNFPCFKRKMVFFKSASSLTYQAPYKQWAGQGAWWGNAAFSLACAYFTFTFVVDFKLWTLNFVSVLPEYCHNISFLQHHYCTTITITYCFVLYICL